MRPLHCILFALPLLASCASTVRVVSPVDDSEVPFRQLADELAVADVVVLGEEHDSEPVHEAHLELLAALHERRPDLIVSMEMFERDVQSALGQYLGGMIDEDEFLAQARPWPNYERDYRPIVEFARAHGLWVIAANAPRDLARRVSREGDAALADLVGSSPDVAEATSAPRDAYWAAFQVAMQEHGDVGGDAAMWRYYQAQCLKDDTMAESIADALRRAYRDARMPLVVHFCGRFHSDYRRGTVARLTQRMPDLYVKVLSVGNLPEREGAPVLSPSQLADYVLLVPRDEEPEAKGEVVALDDVTEPLAPKGHPHSEPGGAVVAGAEPRAVAPQAGDPQGGDPQARDPQAGAPQVEAGADAPGARGQGGRPGLGFRPDYASGEEGCLVAAVIEGGAAEAAGILPGDLIVELDGLPVFDVRSYAQALDTLRVGQKVKVAVLRIDQRVELDAVVGRSAR